MPPEPAAVLLALLSLMPVSRCGPGGWARCAAWAEQWGYDEVNLNCGCPSERVQRGAFGACLMAEPDLVADCVRAMGSSVRVPVTVKTRIGIDDMDSYGSLARFVEHMQSAGCSTIIIHARKAYLQGLSPKENRSVPPLRYDYAYRIKQQFQDMTVVLNGGIESLEAAKTHLERVDGVMLGRSAYHNPYLLAGVDTQIFGDSKPVPSRNDIVERMLPYIEGELTRGTPLKHITRHMLGLYQGVPGARHWRRHLSEYGPRPGAGTDVIQQAMENMQRAGEKGQLMGSGYQQHG